MKTLISITFISLSVICFGTGDFDLNRSFNNNHFDLGLDRTNRQNPFNKTLKLKQESKINLFGPKDGEYGAGKSATLISLALPGVGLYMARRKWIMLAFLPACYGLVGYGSYKMIKTSSEVNTAYDNYLNTKNPDLQSTYMSEVETGREAFEKARYIAGMGAVLWVAQAAWTFIYGNYNDKYRKRNSKWKNTMSSIRGGYDYRTNTTTLNMTIKL